MGWLSWLFGGEKTKVKKSANSSNHHAARKSVDCIEFWQFRATLDKQTPLEWLLRHGETAAEPSKIDKKFGKWVPVTKSRSSLQHEDIGDRPETRANPADQTPHLGEVRSEYLSFLIAYRRIVETPDNGINSLRIDALAERHPKYAGILTKIPPRRRRRHK